MPIIYNASSSTWPTWPAGDMDTVEAVARITGSADQAIAFALDRLEPFQVAEFLEDWREGKFIRRWWLIQEETRKYGTPDAYEGRHPELTADDLDPEFSGATISEEMSHEELILELKRKGVSGPEIRRFIPAEVLAQELGLVVLEGGKRA